MFRKAIIQVLAVILLVAAACQSGPTSMVLVSKDYDNRFAEWLPMAGRQCNPVNMYTVSTDSIDYYLSMADGIIISGGPDVNPVIYGKASETERCESIDNRRDSLELRMISYAMENNIPLLGICRGHQIVNVANKGSLIIDIPSDYDTTVIHRKGGDHMVKIVEGTLLSDLIVPDSGFVNSSHHQAVEDLVGRPFEQVLLALAANGIDHLVALTPLGQEAMQLLGRILEITVHDHHCVATRPFDSG